MVDFSAQGPDQLETYDLLPKAQGEGARTAKDDLASSPVQTSSE